MENSLDREARRQGGKAAAVVSVALRGTPRRPGCDGTCGHRLWLSPALRGGCFCAPATMRMRWGAGSRHASPGMRGELSGVQPQVLSVPLTPFLSWVRDCLCTTKIPSGK